MSERPNKATICSVVFLDIHDQSSKPVLEQIQDKELFNNILSEAIRDVAPGDRTLVSTSDGAVMALSGAPEQAIYIVMMIRDAIVKHNNTGEEKFFVRAGISIAPVIIGSDINGVPEIQGDGVNVAEHLKNLAGPNQILVSRAYYDITSGLTDEIAGMFSRIQGEQEAYSIRSPEEEPFVPESATELTAAAPLLSRLLHSENLPRYGLWGSVALVAIAVLVGGFMLISATLHPDLGAVIADAKPAAPAADVQTISAPTASVQIAAPTSPQVHEAAPNLVEPASLEPIVSIEATPSAAARPVKTRPVPTQPVTTTPMATTVKADTQMDAPESEAITDIEEAEPQPEIVVPKQEEKKVATARPARRGPAVEERELPTTGVRPKTIWEDFRKSFTQGRKERVCSQAEIALNQCD